MTPQQMTPQQQNAHEEEETARRLLSEADETFWRTYLSLQETIATHAMERPHMSGRMAASQKIQQLRMGGAAPGQQAGSRTVACVFSHPQAIIQLQQMKDEMNTLQRQMEEERVAVEKEKAEWDASDKKRRTEQEPEIGMLSVQGQHAEDMKALHEQRMQIQVMHTPTSSPAGAHSNSKRHPHIQH